MPPILGPYSSVRARLHHLFKCFKALRFMVPELQLLISKGKTIDVFLKFGCVGSPWLVATSACETLILDPKLHYPS